MMEAQNVYLDANGGLPLSKSAMDAIVRTGRYTNPSNGSAMAGREAETEYLNASNKMVALLVGRDLAEKWELVNTSGASEGLATCLTSLSGEESPIVIVDTPHPMVDETIMRYDLRTISCGRSKASVQAATRRPSSCCGILITHSISLTGELVDVAAISKAYSGNQPSAPVILDSTQVIGKVPNPFIDIGTVDAIIFSSHKFGGPKGHGGVLLRKSGNMISKWRPLIPGSQQGRRRGGTINVMGISAAAAALEETLDGLQVKWETTSLSMRRLIEAIGKLGLPRVKILHPSTDCTASSKGYTMNTLLLSIPFCSRTFATEMSKRGYDIGIGPACQTDVISISDDPYPYKLRISMAAGTELDVEKFMRTFVEVYRERIELWKEKMENAMDEMPEDLST